MPFIPWTGWLVLVAMLIVAPAGLAESQGEGVPINERFEALGTRLDALERELQELKALAAEAKQRDRSSSDIHYRHSSSAVVETAETAQGHTTTALFATLLVSLGGLLLLAALCILRRSR